MTVTRLIGLLSFLTMAGPHFASAACDNAADNANLVSPDLVNQTAQIADRASTKLTTELTGDQLKLMSERVVDLKNAADAQKLKAAEVQKQLNSQGSCGDTFTQAQCIQKQIDQETARMELMSDDAKAISTKEIAQLQVQLNAPKTLTEGSSTYNQASAALADMVKANDFSLKEHLGIIYKTLLDPRTFKALLTPGPIIALSAGMAGYGIARATPLNKDAKDYYLSNPATGTLSKITDQIGYAYPVLAPFLIVSLVTKNNETMKTFDALAVGTGLSEAIVEPLKYGVGECRPNGADCLAFPSAHAAQTFMMATVLDHEYPGHHHIVGIAAAAGASLVSFYRVQEGNHNPGEIFAGMGIGIATGIAASVGVDNQYAEAEGQKRAYWKDAAMGNFRVPKSDKVVHCVPVGAGGSCNMTW
jgi:membrane-associated phospholipid phosphatase